MLGDIELNREVKWQRILGDIFLEVIEKYNLMKFQGKTKYLIPILAHGYVPDSFLNDYFEHVVLPLYLERRKLGNTGNIANKVEVLHIIENWKREMQTFDILEERIKELGPGPVISAIFRQLGFYDIINGMLTWDEKQCLHSPATHILAIIINILSGRRVALYKVHKV